MLPDLSRREDLAELMDSGSLDERELDETLSLLVLIDRFLGGRRVVLRYLTRWLARWPADRPVTLLDVGTGGGDLPAALSAWARSRGLRLAAAGIDSDPQIARLARRRAPAIEIIEGSLEDLARSGRRFDFVISSLMLHHVPESGLLAAFKAFDALALRGVLISDLRRSWLGYLGAKALTALAGNRITRHDGPVSVRRAFTEEELSALAGRAGLGYLKARRHLGFRLCLAGLKDA